MNDCANEKEILHFLFFNQESAENQILLPPCQRIPQCIALTCDYNAGSQPYDPLMQFQFNHMIAMGIKPLKKKGKMLVECPHKDKRHYAKVYALLGICASIAITDSEGTRGRGFARTPRKLIMPTGNARTAISRSTTRYFADSGKERIDCLLRLSLDVHSSV